MTINLECPHCKHDGTKSDPHLLTTNTNLKSDESLVCISVQHFICGRCRIESPSFVYVRHGDIISHMRDKNGETWFPDGVRHWKRSDDNMWLGDGTGDNFKGLYSTIKKNET